MTATSFWILFYSIAIPIGIVVCVLAIRRNLRSAYGEPELDGRLLLHEDSVRSQSSLMLGAASYRLWITDREVVLRLRPGQGERSDARVETRISADHIASVFQMTADKVRLGLTGGEGRHWDFSVDEPARLLQALETFRSQAIGDSLKP